jgi:hypothetical protein
VTSARQLFLACCFVSCASVASAQTEGAVAVGMNVSIARGPSGHAMGHTNPGFLWRFGHGRTGWGWQYGLSWYATDLQQAIGPSTTAFGELHVRPIMGGYGYTRRFTRTAVTAKLLGGYAFTSFELEPTFDDAYRRTLGARTISTDVSNTFVLKPEISAWVDLGRKIGLNLSAGYMIARPEVTVSSTLGDDPRRIRADMFMFKVGAVYSVF